MKEIWKDIPIHKNYQASNLGRIRSKDRWMPHNVHGSQYFKKGKILTGHKSNCGYVRVGLSYPNGKLVTEGVHRLVAMAFIPNPGKKRTVNHKDCNKINNKKSNLEWSTHKENVDHAVKNGIKAQAKGIQFSTRTRFDELQIRVIKSLKDSHLTQKQIADYFGVNRITINDIFSGRSWRHVI